MVEGERTSGRYNKGDNVTMKCDEEFSLLGSNYSHCSSQGTWQPVLGICVPNEQGKWIYPFW